MSHSNGRIYIDRTVTPNIGINTFDVSYVLGRSTDDIGQLCGDVDGSGNSVGSVNPKGLIKPMRSAFPGVLSTAQRRAGNYGYKIDGKTTADLAYTDRLLNFGWLKPRGSGQNPKEWFRITDFDGYDHNADWPFTFGPRGGSSFYQDGSGTFNVELPDDILQWASFSGSWYIGIMVERNGTRYYYPVTTESSAQTTEDILDDGYFGVPFPSSMFPNVGTYNASLLLTTVGSIQQAWTVGTPAAGTFVAFPLTAQYDLVTATLTMYAEVDHWTGQTDGDSDFVVNHIFVPVQMSAPAGVVTNVNVEIWAEDYSHGSTPRRVTLGTLNNIGVQSRTLDFDCGMTEVVSLASGRVGIHMDVTYRWGRTTKYINDLGGGIGYISEDNKH